MFRKIFAIGLMCFSGGVWAEMDLTVYERYLNGIETLKGDFRQSSPTGQMVSGKIHISRPGKMRLNYNPPSPLLIVADGEWLITYDKELDETNYISLNKTPAEFILRPNIQFGGDVQVTSVIPYSNDTTAVTLVKKGEHDEGQITLVFADDPVSLEEWTVTDPQGSQTHVELSNLKLNEPVAQTLFQFNKPSLVEQVL